MPQLFHSWPHTQTPDSIIDIFEPHVYWHFIRYHKQNEPTYLSTNSWMTMKIWCISLPFIVIYLDNKMMIANVRIKKIRTILKVPFISE